MVKKNYLGKVVKQIDGFRIRHMLTQRTERGAGGRDVVHNQPNGFFGAYAGKKLLCDGDKYRSVEEVETFLENFKK